MHTARHAIVDVIVTLADTRSRHAQLVMRMETQESPEAIEMADEAARLERTIGVLRGRVVTLSESLRPAPTMLGMECVTGR